MKKELRHFLMRGFEIAVLFFLLDITFTFTERPFPVYPEPEFWGTILLYLLVGYFAVGLPFLIKLYKKTKIWQNFAKKWQLDKELPDR